MYNSSYNVLYRSLISSNQYLKNKVPIDRQRVLAQLRLSGNKVKIYFNRIVYEWDQSEVCSICNLKELETLKHFFMVCPQYQHIRAKFLGDAFTSCQNLENIFASKSRKEMNSIYYYVTGALRLRAFIRNE